MEAYVKHLPESLAADEIWVIDDGDFTAQLRALDVVVRPAQGTFSESSQAPTLAQWATDHSAMLALSVAAKCPDVSWAAFIDPVTYAADLRDVRLATLPVLSATESRELIGVLNEFLADDPETRMRDLQILDVAGQWFLCAQRGAGLSFQAAPTTRLLGHALRDHPVEGADARLVKRWMTEVQMLLHSHAINRDRAASGAPLINGIWCHGAGAEPRSPEGPVSLPSFAGDHTLLRGLWQWTGNDVSDELTGGCVVLASERGDEALIALTERCARRLLVSDAEGVVSATQRRWWQRWSRRRKG